MMNRCSLRSSLGAAYDTECSPKIESASHPMELKGATDCYVAVYAHNTRCLSPYCHRPYRPPTYGKFFLRRTLPSPPRNNRRKTLTAKKTTKKLKHPPVSHRYERQTRHNIAARKKRRIFETRHKHPKEKRPRPRAAHPSPTAPLATWCRTTLLMTSWSYIKTTHSRLKRTPRTKRTLTKPFATRLGLSRTRLAPSTKMEPRFHLSRKRNRWRKKTTIATILVANALVSLLVVSLTRKGLKKMVLR